VEKDLERDHFLDGMRMMWWYEIKIYKSSVPIIIVYLITWYVALIL